MARQDDLNWTAELKVTPGQLEKEKPIIRDATSVAPPLVKERETTPKPGILNDEVTLKKVAVIANEITHHYEEPLTYRPLP